MKKLMSEFEAHLQTFNNEKEFNDSQLKEQVGKGKQMIDELSEKFAQP